MASSKSRALTRDIILSAALELVDDAGLSALSLAEPGQALGGFRRRVLSPFS